MQAIFHSLRGGSPETESSRGIFRRTDKLHVGFRPNLDGRGVTAGALDSLGAAMRLTAGAARFFVQQSKMRFLNSIG